MSIQYPIIVAFSMPVLINEKLVVLNDTCNKNKGIDFNSHIPHLTLWMGFVEDVGQVKKSFYKVFKQIEIEIQIKDASIFTGINGDVLSLNISKNSTLEVLQNRIHHFLEPYRVVGEDEQLDPETLMYMNNFASKSCLNYDPHITIGYRSELLSFSIEKFKVEEPTMFLAGNKCTCVDVIHS